MISASLPIISADTLQSLPAYYRALAKHLADTGRVVIKEHSEEVKTA